MASDESIASGIIDGELCQFCHGPLLDGDSFSVCEVCRQFGEGRKHYAEQSRLAADDDFATAFALASKHGMKLIRKSNVHYQLIGPTGWLINIYPGNHRLYHDRNKPGPFIRVERQVWTLISVVEAAIKAVKK